ncbi:MAG TPA: hypothetical protein VGI64_03250 [Streptosporangiaceae bacterium]|jgi:hypothetical protein
MIDLVFGWLAIAGAGLFITIAGSMARRRYGRSGRATAGTPGDAMKPLRRRASSHWLNIAWMITLALSGIDAVDQSALSAGSLSAGAFNAGLAAGQGPARP